MSNEDKRAKGVALAKTILAGSPRGPNVPEKFRRYSLEHLFGDVWQGEEMSTQERSLITCSMLVALNREAEQQIHFRAARNFGIEREKIEGMIIHAAHYAGWPVAATALRVLAEVWPED